MATGREKVWRTVVVLVALAGSFAWLAGRVQSPGVEIGTAIQSLSPNGDAAARHTEAVAYDDDDVELVAAYVVVDGRLAAGAPAPHQALWELARAVLPPHQLGEIRQLNVITDGPNGTLGMVHRSGVVADRWVLSLDDAESADVLDETLVHELAHLLTLRRSDLDARTQECRGVRIAIGCATTGSTLAEWSDAFWVDPTRAADFDDDEFVSEYAASAVHEDLAESFLAYVLDDEPPRSAHIAEKLAFFDAHPDLAAVADEVRVRLAVATPHA